MKSNPLSFWKTVFGSLVIGISICLYWLRFCSAESLQEANRERLAEDTFANRLALAAVERTRHRVRYDPAYVVLDYPGGDVPADTGVCTDLMIRSYRTKASVSPLTAKAWSRRFPSGRLARTASFAPRPTPSP